MVVILAAGKGSRMHLKKDISKCSIVINETTQDTTITRLIKQFVRCGERRFTVIVGYGAESVINSINCHNFEVSGLYHVFINYVYNPYYKKYGCEYSLSLIENLDDSLDDLIIVEGDLVVSDYNIKGIFCQDQTCVLCCSPEWISKKSVVIVKRKGVVSQFLYDPSHETDFNSLSNKEKLYESMQIWKFVGSHDVSCVKILFKEYRIKCEQGVNTNASGLESINRFVDSYDMDCCLTQHNTEWMNLNTKEDIEDLKSQEWF
jgi:choline kinase